LIFTLQWPSFPCTTKLEYNEHGYSKHTTRKNFSFSSDKIFMWTYENVYYIYTYERTRPWQDYMISYICIWTMNNIGFVLVVKLCSGIWSFNYAFRFTKPYKFIDSVSLCAYQTCKFSSDINPGSSPLLVDCKYSGGLYNPVAKYFGTCLKIRILIELLRKK
jgi:hypothetical protein